MTDDDATKPVTTGAMIPRPEPGTTGAVIPRPEPLASEQVVIAAPFSLAGSAERIWPLTRRTTHPYKRAALIVLTVTLIALVWAGICVWYLMWGLFLVPYRLIRRGQRKRQREALQHRETLAAIERSHDQP
jgi:hypothetical protein